MDIISRIKGLPRMMEPAVELWEEAGDCEDRSDWPYRDRFTLFTLTALVPFGIGLWLTGTVLKEKLQASRA